ncbi:dermonecrotic toxin domain-containing protein [Pseudomonas sp. P2757]|uniref:dermonecrotic toxin domain-containing protein n=1 Tax=unclassified Pseudomonas TaxID=196821 RepID=UPI003B5A1657
MSAPSKPLLFPEAFNSPGLWRELGLTHDLSEQDFKWLAHAKLSSATLRSEQTPAMHAERIMLNFGDQIPLPLPGAFVLGETPGDKGLILYTPYDGIKKYADRASLKLQLEQRLNDADDQDNLLAFLAMAQRKRLLDADSLSLTFSTIEGDVFEDQTSAIRQGQLLNAQAMREELKQLPALTALLDSALDELLKAHFGALQQSRTRVSFYTVGDDAAATDKHWLESMSLSDAVLLHYRHQRWPGAALREFANPARQAADKDQQQWEDAVKSASSKLPALLFRQLERYWDAPSADGSPRRDFFAQVLQDQACAEWMGKRETGILEPAQFDALHQLIRPTASGPHRPVTETVRLWEHPANYVELAGSLLISGSNAYLYTPAQGLQLLNDYQDLKQTLQSKFMAKGHEEELYGLLGLEERKRFIGFHEPQVSGERMAGTTFKMLFELIITKQRQNIDYALQVFRHSDGHVNLQALFDKSLDIRSMIHQRLLELDSAGRWSTHPVLSGNQQPSLVLADKALAAIKTFASLEGPLEEMLKTQPMATMDVQRPFLEQMRADLAHAWSVGVNAEARLRALSGTLAASVQAIVNTVINADQPTRALRPALDGFRPDAYALTLKSAGQQSLLPLAHCLLMTERGGLDVQHSGRAVLWTPALGLEVFATVAVAQRMLDRRLLHSVQRLSLLENLLPTQHLPHQRYTLGEFQFIEHNVLHNRMQSTIEHFLGRCEQLRKRVTDPVKRNAALALLRDVPLHTNLKRSTEHARAIATQQTYPAWLGMAPVAEQKLHVELLEQWQQSVVDAKDYLSGVPSLVGYVEQALQTLLDNRFPGSQLNPHHIEITPNLALAGPARTLVEFALNHINIAQGTGFKVASKTTDALPAGLDQSAVTQLLLSLTIPATFGKKVTDALSVGTVDGLARKQRFFRQLPWQLLQHAHALKLQQHLSDTAFSFIRQVLDMPDAIARAAVAGAHAIACPLALVKTVGAQAVTALGLYVFAPGVGHKGPLILYAPYTEQAFHEFADEQTLISALNTSGSLQNLLLRRLPEAQQAVFRNLLTATLGQTSEIKLANVAIGGNLLEQLYQDNLGLLTQMLGAQKHSDGQFDWETAKVLFSDEIRQSSEMLQGKLAYFRFLWQAYDEFKDSAEALQNHHWKRALKSFIEGAAQMVLVGLLPELSADSGLAEATVEETQTPLAPNLAQIESTAPQRTALQSFEVTDVALKDLKHSATDAVYRQTSNNRNYAEVDGKVYGVVSSSEGWQLARDDKRGPTLVKSGSRMVQVTAGQTVHYGKAISKMVNRSTYSTVRRTMLNIEAEGMEEINQRFPEKARVLGHAVDLARYYAFNCLHNLAILDIAVSEGRVNRFLMDLFDVPQITAPILVKIKNTIEPLCNALVDPNDELLNTKRFIVGSTRYMHDVIAFVLDGDQQKKVHFTQHFFDQQLHDYANVTARWFDIDGHAQAATLIHEFAHQFSKAWDIATVRAREPFADLISSATRNGSNMKIDLQDAQKMALSLATPRAQLFAQWNTKVKDWISFESIPDVKHMSSDILKLTNSKTMNEARNAFLDRQSPDVRIDVILRNADSIARLICEVGRQLDTVPTP